MSGRATPSSQSGTPTTCAYCGVGCGVLARPDGGITGDTRHPSNFGRLCSKGSALGETIGLEGRVLHPTYQGLKTDWASALDLVAGKFARAIADYGPDSVAFYVSGQLLTEDYYVANKLMKGYIGTANIDTNSRLCMASSVAGHRRAFGADTVPGTYEDLEEADLVVLVGSNLAWCHPVLFQRIAAAKATRPGLRVINIDPRRTATSDLADLHLGIRPDGDVALFNTLLSEIAETGAVDEDYVAAHVDGFKSALKAARATAPSETGLSAEEVARFCEMWIGTEKVVTVYSQGVNQSRSGTDKVNAILNCHLATGRIGKPGTGPFSVTGQPNAMGGREVGGLANMLACHLDIENAVHRDAVREFWGSPVMASTPGFKAVDLFQACASGQIKALWIMATNPAVSLPEADGVAAAIANVPFTVVSDVMADTDTTRLADMVLPATAWGEKSGTVTNSERMISRQRGFLPAPGGARHDWKIVCEVAERMGWGAAFAFDGPAAIFREFAALSGVAGSLGRDFDISGLAELSDADYEALTPTRWPVTDAGEQGGRFFAEGGFYHPNGKAKMMALKAPRMPSEKRPFRLNTGRVRDHWHTMTRTGKSARLSQHLAEPYIEIHPEDAASLGLAAADLALVESDSGAAILRVLVSARAAQGSVFAPMHWTRVTAPAGRVGPLIRSVVDPVSGQPASKGSYVGISRFNAAWYGFAASRAEMRPTRPYWSVARTETGQSVEIAGMKEPADWEAEARTVLNLPHGRASLALDAAAGTARVAVEQDGVLTGLFFAATSPVAVARRQVIGLIGTDTSALVALAGRGGADRPDPGAVVCSCFGVGINTLRAAAIDGAGSVAALGDCTQAGTNCGSCKPELQAIVDAVLTQVAAE